MYTYIGSQTQPYNNYSYKPWIGGGKAGPPTWVTVTHLAVHYCRNNVHSNTKSVQLKDCIEWLKVYIIKCSDILRLYLSNGVFLPSITTVKHTHIPQMPISAQQWRLAVGQANASRSLRPYVTGQPKMKLTSWDVLLFILTSLQGAILLEAILMGATLSKDSGREMSEKSE